MQRAINLTDDQIIKMVRDGADLEDSVVLEIADRATSNDIFYNRLFDVYEDVVPIRNLGLRAADIRERMAAEKPSRTITTHKGMILAEDHARAKLIRVADVKEQEASWLIPGYIPRYQITVLAADGGVGKTTMECELAAAITTGKRSFITAGTIPDDFQNEPENVLFFAAEDSFTHVLKRKLRKSGADMERIFTANVADPGFINIKFNSPDLVELIKESRPGLVIFDPIQNFVPPDIQMGWRNAMRQCLNPLIGIGEEYGATFLIACHTNKQSGVYGRKRIAESADIWDIARSVLMAGETYNGGIKYLSHEKSNYGELQQTILFTINDEHITVKGHSDLHDADYCLTQKRPKAAPERDDAKELIQQCLQDNGGKMEARALDEQIIAKGVSTGTLKRAKTELKTEQKIRFFKTGFEDGWHIELT